MLAELGNIEFSLTLRYGSVQCQHRNASMWKFQSNLYTVKSGYKKMIEKSSEDMDAKEHHTAIKLQDITFASSNIAFLKSTVLM